jgi:polysaccharide export outer membrane protein
VSAMTVGICWQSVLRGLVEGVLVFVLTGSAALAQALPRYQSGPSEAVRGRLPERSERGPQDDTLRSALPSDYVIGPEDVLDISVFGVPELSESVRVANDGTISLPLLGHVEAAGCTTRQLRQALESRYGEDYLQDPQINIFVKEFHSDPVSVIGAVEKPGLYHLVGPRSLIEVLSMAGGLAKRDSAYAGPTVYVTRKGGFSKLELAEGMRLVAPNKLEINLRKLIYSEQNELDIQIQPLDVISVSKADIIYVIGAVQKPGGFVLEDRDKVTVLQALALAEGLQGTAAKKHARIIRTSEDGTRVEIPLDIGKVLKGEKEDLDLGANDILFVPGSTGKMALRRGLEATVGTLSGVLIYSSAH